jgi:ATP-independent RNA helicase DbpA
MAQFSSLPLSPELLRVVAELGYENLTPIQAEAIPHLLAGRDLVGQSKTGSGKTAAFSIPILQSLHLKNKSIQALVLCPTRELCSQVAREIRKLGRLHPGLHVLVISGGQPMFPQLSALEKGVHIVVGTPGRVLDHLKRKSMDLSQARAVVLDEADRMLDMGFQEDMEKILGSLPKDRQTIFFSATFPNSIASMSRAYQRKPVSVKIESDESSQANIRQLFYQADPETRAQAVAWLLQQHQPESAIVFCNFKADVAELAKTLSRSGVSVGSLHGDLEQNDRDRVMAKFRNASTRVLVATDVAARGIDIDSLDLVINYDLPQKTEVYVHRIGRTGRAGKQGLAVSLFISRDKSKIQMIEKATGTRAEIKTMASARQLEVEAAKTDLHQQSKMQTLFISGGRKEKVRPGDILGALTGEAGGLDASDVGKIEIHDHFSYVAVSSDIAQMALQRLRNGKIKGRKFRIEPVR